MRNYNMAVPRKPEEIGRLPYRPEVLIESERRGISQVVHFTTSSGALGILATKAVKSRKRLPDDRFLEHVYRPNARLRKDTPWLDYVNLSIERINDWMFATSTRWHVSENVSWVALAFSPEILAHPGVVFTTTNNIYPACLRSEGLAGFTAMFADVVIGRYDSRHDRVRKLDTWPTDRQAEVLYPGELSCEFLQRIDVQLEETFDLVHGMLAGLALNVPVRHAPEVFQ